VMALGSSGGHENLAYRRCVDRRAHRGRTFEQHQATLTTPATAQQLASSSHSTAANAQDGLAQLTRDSRPQAAGAA
jgi:hypothetical protein